MSDENLVVDQEVVQTVPDTSVEVDAYEQQAREQGWKPKEEFEGDQNKWRPAREFVERGELFGKIDSMGKELKETKKALKMLQDHHAKVKETEYKRAIDELRSLQKQHLENGDSDKYLETTELLTDLKAEQKAREVATSIAAPQGPDPRFVAWVDQNKWYNTDPELREFADTIGMGYAARNPGADPTEVLQFVSTQVKSKYKNKFENPNRTKQSVEGASTPTATKGQIELTEEERKVMNTFIRQNVMTKDEYLAEIKKMRGLK